MWTQKLRSRKSDPDNNALQSDVGRIVVSGILRVAKGIVGRACVAQSTWRVFPPVDDVVRLPHLHYCDLNQRVIILTEQQVLALHYGVDD